MNLSGALHNGEIVARSSLLDALFALEQIWPRTFVVVGAQAVYLRTLHVQLPIPPLTFDGDILADPRRVRRPRAILDALEKAGFEIRGYNGLYHHANVPDEIRAATRVDIFVPDRFQNEWELQGWVNRDAQAVMAQAGLELALFENSIMTISGMGNDIRTLEIKVAGTVALLVAKGWKIGERHEQGAEAFPDVAKDVADVYRLLLASDEDALAAALAKTPRESRFVDTARKGSNYLRKLCTAGGDGLDLLRTPQMLGRSDAAELVIESLGHLVTEFCTLVEQMI